MEYETADMGFAGVLHALGFRVTSSDSTNPNRIIFKFVITKEENEQVQKLVKDYESNKCYAVDCLSYFMSIRMLKNLVRTLANSQNAYQNNKG